MEFFFCLKIQESRTGLTMGFHVTRFLRIIVNYSARFVVHGVMGPVTEPSTGTVIIIARAVPGAMGLEGECKCH